MKQDRPFRSAAPRVELISGFSSPLDTAVAAARTCTSSRGVVLPGDVAGDGIADPAGCAEAQRRRNALARDLYKAGHHTTFQHVHFQFALAGVSRHFIWGFLHSHPYYNSEQVSQRYVEVRPGAFLIPDLAGPAQGIYEASIERAMKGYGRLATLLHGPASSHYFKRFPARSRRPATWEKEVRRRAQEVARYVLPVATLSHLCHTISAVTLLRYWRLCESMDTPAEQRLVVGSMMEQVLNLDPAFSEILEDPLPLEETPEHRFFSAGPLGGPEATPGTEVDRHRFRAEFDSLLGDKPSALAGAKTGNETLLAQSAREVLGLPASRLSDSDAIDLVLDPSRNRLLGETLNLTTLSKLTRALFHPSYTFRKRLSHTADSQDQRHRTTPASRPCRSAYLSDDPDYIVPELIRHERAAMEEYRSIMEDAWESIGKLRRLGVPDEMAAYLLPNALALRFMESADLLSLRHKMAMRLCFNAQEEIWRASLAEALAVREVDPRIGRHLLPPCGLRIRAGTRPWCPEGRRYCGVPVWQYDTAQFERVI